MKKSGVRKSLSLTTRSPGILRRGVFLGYCGRKFERRLEVVLLAGTMGVLGSLAAYAGSSSVPLGTDIGNMAPGGSVAAQTVDECLERDIKPWDIACLLLRPVGTVPDFPLSGPGDRESNADDDDTTTTSDDDDDDTTSSDGPSHSRSGLGEPDGAPGSNPGRGSGKENAGGLGGSGTGNPHN